MLSVFVNYASLVSIFGAVPDPVQSYLHGNDIA